MIWDVTNPDLIHEGKGELQLSFVQDEVMVKSCISSYRVYKSVLPTGEIPDPIDDWITRAEAALAEIPHLVEVTVEEKVGELIDDSAGEYVTNRTWSANKLVQELNQKADVDDLMVVPVFSNSGGSIVCDMSVADVYSAIENKRCNSCKYNTSSYPLYVVTPTAIVFAYTAVGGNQPVATFVSLLFSSDESVQALYNNLDLTDYIAPSYSRSIFPVSVGDLCIIDNYLYKANTDIASYETFDQSKWNQTTIDQNFATKANPKFTGSISMGRKENTTVGAYSSVNGYNAEATAQCSQAEGFGTRAINNQAHAEGENTTASGIDSHSEGVDTIASSWGSHSEGNITTASGMYAHSEGISTTASGDSSHSQGIGTIANHRSQITTGEYNIADSSNADASQRGNYVEIVGNGTANNARSNARTLDWNGNEELAGDVTVFKGTANEMSLSTLKALIDGKISEPDLEGSDGQVLTTNGQGGRTWEDIKGVYVVNIIPEEPSVPFQPSDPNNQQEEEPGKEIIMPGQMQDIDNNGDLGTPVSLVTYSLDKTFAEIKQAYDEGKFIVAIEHITGTFYPNNRFVSDVYYYVDSIETTNDTRGTIVLSGRGNKQFIYSVEQLDDYPSGTSEITIGVDEIFIGNESIVQSDGIAVIPFASAREAGVVMLDDTAGTGDTDIVWSADKITSELAGKVDASERGVANGIAELDGTGKVKSAQLPSYVDDVVEYADLASFPQTGESGKLYVALDTNKVYRWSGSTYIEINPVDISSKADKADTVLDTTLSRGRTANTTVGMGSFAFGSNVEASGAYSHAEGGSNVASGYAAHAEGSGGAVASGAGSHAEGSGTRAEGVNSHAEGVGSKAVGAQSHAEGAGTIAFQNGAHTEGFGTQAIGQNSHAEGINTVANADYSHVGGAYNVPDSIDWDEWVSETSYAVGDKVKRTTTIDNKSVVTGYICKTANSDSTFDTIKWTRDSQMNYAEIVGNGVSNNARSNARTLDWNGNERLAGDVYVHCNADSAGGNRVATESELHITPIFTQDLSNPLNYVCNMTFQEVSNAVENGKCDGCIFVMPIGARSAVVALTLSSSTPSSIAFVQTVSTSGYINTIQIGFLPDETVEMQNNVSEFYDKFAPEYAFNTGLFPVKKGEYCICDAKLLKANTDIPVYEAFNSAKWYETSVGDELYLIASNSNAMIANVEEDNASDHAYAVGDIFVYDNKLYKATSAIAVNDYIIPNTNCIETTVRNAFTPIVPVFEEYYDLAARKYKVSSTMTYAQILAAVKDGSCRGAEFIPENDGEGVYPNTVYLSLYDYRDTVQFDEPPYIMFSTNHVMDGGRINYVYAKVNSDNTVDYQGYGSVDVNTIVLQYTFGTSTTRTLDPLPRSYNFSTKNSITVTVESNKQYRFMFTCPSNAATTLTMNGVTETHGDTIEANKTYIVDIWNGIATIVEKGITLTDKEDKSFNVTFNLTYDYTNDTWEVICDKTVAEIGAAYDAGKTIEAIAIRQNGPFPEETKLTGNTLVSMSGQYAIVFSGRIFLNSIEGCIDINITGATGVPAWQVILVPNKIKDVQINGTSIISNNVANIPLSDANTLGVAKTDSTYGVYRSTSNNAAFKDKLIISNASDNDVKLGTNTYKPITPSNQNKSVFYGLAKVAGADMASSSNDVGTYTDEAKQSIQSMLGTSAMIAPLESDLSASTQAYAVGGLFIANGKLYKATSAIAVGDAIVPNTNCVETTIDDEFPHGALIAVQDETPTDPNTQIWLPETQPQSVTVPTMADIPEVPVQDVQVNGTSVLNNGVANIPKANSSTYGVITVGAGLAINASGQVSTDSAGSGTIKAGANINQPIVPGRQHASVFYGLAKASGDTTQASSSNEVGIYTADAKASIQSMLGVPGDVQVNGTSVVNNSVANIPKASNDTFGVAKTGGYGVRINNDGVLYINPASVSSEVKPGASNYLPIVPATQHASTFYGLSKVAGVDLANETVTLGTYPETSKTAIRSMLGAVGDVQLDNTSVVSNGIATIPIAGNNANEYGVVKINFNNGINVAADNCLSIVRASEYEAKNGSNAYKVCVPFWQHQYVYYGLSKLAGVDLKNETVTVGVYPQASKTAIQSLIGVEPGVTFVETVSGSTPSITGEPNVRYVCGTVTELTITPPNSGTIEVIFVSGTTPTVLSIPNTVILPDWVDLSDLETSTKYDIIITDGTMGSVMTWAE